MNHCTAPYYPILGMWRLIRATDDGSDINVPPQEGEFFADGTCTHLIQSSKSDKVYRRTGKYFIDPPNHIWTEMESGMKGAKQEIEIANDVLQLRHRGIIHYLKSIQTSEFTLPIVYAQE